MINMGLFGGGFHHAYSSTSWKVPKNIKWEKNTICDINCFMEDEIIPNIGKHPNVKKWAWVLESSPIIEKYNKTISTVKNNYKEISESYDFLISHDRSIYSLASNFYYFPPHGTWVLTPQIYPKTKICSMISSNKRMVDGHNYRLNWVDKLRNKVDLYGTGFNPFYKKEDALADYMFSVTIENTQYETYWTEKILDCFACGTIPIYHGAPDLGNYFNMDGIIILDDNFNVENLTSDLYLSKEDAIIDNYERAMKYDIIEDLIWEKFFKNNAY